MENRLSRGLGGGFRGFQESPNFDCVSVGLGAWSWRLFPLEIFTPYPYPLILKDLSLRLLHSGEGLLKGEKISTSGVRRAVENLRDIRPPPSGSGGTERASRGGLLHRYPGELETYSPESVSVKSPPGFCTGRDRRSWFASLNFWGVIRGDFPLGKIPSLNKLIS